MLSRLTREHAKELLASTEADAAQLAEIAAKYPDLRDAVSRHANAASMLLDWIARQRGTDPADGGTGPAPSAPHVGGASVGSGRATMPEWERRLADKEVERLRRARLDAEEELQSLVRSKSLIESEVEIARQNLTRARSALEAENARIRDVEGRINDQIGARSELDDVVKILRTNLGDLEYVVEQESLAYAQAESRLVQVQRERGA